ncbi:MAG: SPOR domain-containing protein, partial [Pontibacter sp.]|nr:SPOR domain-containing protein [Pontibacter sp.]
RRRIKRAYNVAAGLALAGLSVTALYFLSLQADYNLSSLSPMVLFTNTYSTAASVEPNRYASDYVPFTEDERFYHYQAMHPDARVTAIADEAASTELTDEDANADVLDQSLTLEEGEDNVAGEVVTAESVAEENAEEIKAPAHIINNRDGRFYIIHGGYARLENAEMSRSEFIEKGHEVKVLTPQPGSRLFRVSVADFGSSEEAQTALNTYRKKFGDTLWVLNN